MSDLPNVKADALALAAAFELQRMNLAWSTSMAFRSWHLTQLGAGLVKAAQDHLRRSGYEFYYPMMYRARAIGKNKLSKAQRKHADRFKTYRREPLFRGYMFVRLDVRGDRWHEVFREAGVYGIACAGDLPYDRNGARHGEALRISFDALIERLHSQADADGDIPGETPISAIFEVGELVRISEGPFRWHNATIEEVGADGLIKAAVEIFGRSTTTTFEFTDIEKV